MSLVDHVKQAADDALDRNVEELRALCRIPSRRWEPEAMLRTAQMLDEVLTGHGVDVSLVEWPETFPYVIGTARSPRSDAPTLLHYNHYDVDIEPAGDDADLLHPPFAAEVHDGKIYARGVADDKAPLLSRVHAVAAFHAAGVPLPVNVTFLLEGKVHLHSPGMPSFVEAHAEELRCDAVLWENSWVSEDGRPLLKLGEKGLLYVRLAVRRLARDGSSQNSAVLPHAARDLVTLLASLQDADGRVRIDGFYGDVRDPGDRALALVDAVGFDAARLAQVMGDPALADLDSATAARALRLTPTLTITSLTAGVDDDGVALRLPGSAAAKLEFRLVADQDPDVVLEQLRAHLDAQGVAGWELETLGVTRPSRTDHDDAFVAVVADAARRAYGVEPLVEPFTPLVGNQAAMRGVPIVGVGVGRAWSASDPNQHVYISDYRTAVHHIIEVMAGMGGLDDEDAEAGRTPGPDGSVRAVDPGDRGD